MISGRVTMTGRTRGSARLSLVCRAVLLFLVPRRRGASGGAPTSCSGPAVARSPWGGGGLLSRAFPLWWGVVVGGSGSCRIVCALRGSSRRGSCRGRLDSFCTIAGSSRRAVNLCFCSTASGVELVKSLGLAGCRGLPACLGVAG